MTRAGAVEPRGCTVLVGTYGGSAWGPCGAPIEEIESGIWKCEAGHAQ